MSKKNKNIEKYVAKRLSKLINSMSEYSSACECRISVISGKYGFAVINTAKSPTDNHSIMDYLNKLMKTKTYHALNNDITYDFVHPMDMKELKARIYDGTDLKYVTSTKLLLTKKSEPDYAKIQGIDLDEAADRQMDNYIDTADARKAHVMYKTTAEDKQLFQLYEKNKELERRIEAINRDMEGSQKAYEKQNADLEAKETELKRAYDKAAEDYETIQKLTKEVGDLKIQIGKQNEEIFQLKHPTPIEASSIVPATVKPNTLSTIVTDINTKIDKLAEKVDSVETKEDKPEKPTGPDYAYPVALLRPKDNREIELEDEYAFRRLDEIKKPYSLRDIFKIVHNEMYTEIYDNVYNLLGEIENPVRTQVKKYPRQAYALAIALAAPASYVSAFRDRLIKDYRKGDFVPTRKSCMPENFENLLECLYPEICRIQQILFHDTNKLPYVYKKYSKNGLYTFYMIGAKSYDTPDEVPTKTYVAIPKDEEPYEYIKFGREEKLMYVLEHGQCMKNRDPLAAMNDCEYGPERLYSDYPHTLKDQIDEMIGASEETIITLDTTDPEEVYKTQLRYYPIYPAYTDTFVNEPEKPDESSSSALGVTMGKKSFESPVHKDELPDDYMLTLLQNTKKAYDLRTIFKLQSNIYDKIDPDVYMNLIGIRDPRTINVRIFSRTAYAAAIALSVPEGYVGSFIRRLIDDYKCGDFRPTDPKYVPEDFPNFLKSLYPDIARIHRLLHSTDKRDLPYVCKKEVGTSTEYYMIGARPYDNPAEIEDAKYYIAIPKEANPYDFLEYDKTKELVMIFDCFTPANRRRPIKFVMDNTDAGEFRDNYDNISTMRDQINRYIAADEAGLISIGCNNPDEILMNGLWFYPVVWGYTVEKFQ